MVILSLLLDMVKHSQSTQSNKFVISLQYLEKEFRKGVNFLHADEQSSYKLGLLLLMEVARSVQSTQNRKLVIFFAQSVAAAFVFYCDTKHSDILGWSSHVYCYILVSLHSQIRNFLMFRCFQQKQGILQQIILCPSNKPKKACIRSFDTNNFTQSPTRKYHCTATESLYCLCDEKISWTPILEVQEGTKYQLPDSSECAQVGLNMPKVRTNSESALSQE